MKNVIVFGSESTGMAVCQKIIEECPSVSGGGGIISFSVLTITLKDGMKL